MGLKKYYKIIKRKIGPIGVCAISIRKLLRVACMLLYCS